MSSPRILLLYPNTLKSFANIYQTGHGIINFIQSYLHQFFDDSHGLKASLKPLKRPFDKYQSRLEAINNGRDIRQINW